MAHTKTAEPPKTAEANHAKESPTKVAIAAPSALSPLEQLADAADTIDMTVDDYAPAQHVVFYIRDIPVFYFPFTRTSICRCQSKEVLAYL